MMNDGNGRKAGILLSMSSLPVPGGSGALGAEAYAFLDFLAAAGQSYWQILPIGPVGKSLSPYQLRSAFAGNPAFVCKDLTRDVPKRKAPKSVSYTKFLEENENWLDDYALFEAVHASQKERALAFWPDDLRNPSAKTLTELRERFKKQIVSVRHEQYNFYTQWMELKHYANSKGVGIIGDLPIYVYEDSAEFWLRRGAFDVSGDGRPRASAGVPPDAFSKGGQLWNNPVYDWDNNKKKVWAFWRERLTQAARLYDGVRIDHFRGLADYYAIPIDRGLSGKGAPAWNNGEWRSGPGKPFIDMMKKDYPGLFVIAEDLGKLSEAAKTLVKESAFPGMKVLQFAFSGGPDNPYLPHNIPRNAVAYTGTHDNNTLLGWLNSAPKQEQLFAMEYLGLSVREDLPKAMLAAVLASRAGAAVIPLQDWLGLGAEARMNKPGIVSNRNWKWQYEKGALSRRLSEHIRHCVKDVFAR